MAQAQSAQPAVIHTADIRLTAKQAAELIERASVDGEATPNQKIGAVAEVLLAQMADGGLMLTADEIQRISEATGVDPETGEDLVKVLSEATGIVEGMTRVSVLIDPSYIPAYEEIAKMQGRDVTALFQETMDAGLEQEWCYNLTPGQRPETVLMRPEDKADLEQMLGEKFLTGTDLAALVRKNLGGGLFEDAEPVESNVGQGVEA